MAGSRVPVGRRVVSVVGGDGPESQAEAAVEATVPAEAMVREAPAGVATPEAVTAHSSRLAGAFTASTIASAASATNINLLACLTLSTAEPFPNAFPCGALLAALDASEGRRRRRKRDTTPDAIGMSLKRSLLDAAIADDPDPDTFEGWLLDRCLDGADAASFGGLQAMARDILTEWRLAAASPASRDWLEAGAPSADR